MKILIVLVLLGLVASVYINPSHQNSPRRYGIKGPLHFEEENSHEQFRRHLRGDNHLQDLGR